MALKKLKITAYSDPNCSKKKSGVEPYEVQFNPNKVDEGVKVEYTSDNPSGATDEVKKFKGISASDFKLSLTLDATGVAGPKVSKGQSKDVDIIKEIKAFKEVTCTYDGETHDVPYVNIEWGDFSFKGRLSQLNISHVLFNSQGKPLRSVLDATFTSAKDLKTQAKENGRSSPDLTHVRTVKIGDTLPLMCQGIYNDSSYYLKVAKFNNLVDFRNLEPGTEIIFPPII